MKLKGMMYEVFYRNSDLDKSLYHYGSTHFQDKDISNKPILPKLVKMLKDKGHAILDSSNKRI